MLVPRNIKTKISKSYKKISILNYQYKKIKRIKYRQLMQLFRNIWILILILKISKLQIKEKMQCIEKGVQIKKNICVRLDDLIGPLKKQANTQCDLLKTKVKMRTLNKIRLIILMILFLFIQNNNTNSLKVLVINIIMMILI